MFESLSAMFGGPKKPLKTPTPAMQGAPSSVGQITQNMQNDTKAMLDPMGPFKKRTKAAATSGNFGIMSLGGLFGR
jgi:hypothetical protein